MDISIRAARQTDIRGMMELMDQLYTRDLSATLPTILAEYIRSNATCLVQVAETKDEESPDEMPKIIGAIIGSYRLDLEMEARCGFVDGIVVDADFRSQGIGKLLMQSFASWTLSKQCTLMQLFSVRGDWFNSLGFEVRQVHLHQMNATQLAN